MLNTNLLRKLYVRKWCLVPAVSSRTLTEQSFVSIIRCGAEFHYIPMVGVDADSSITVKNRRLFAHHFPHHWKRQLFKKACNLETPAGLAGLSHYCLRIGLEGLKELLSVSSISNNDLLVDFTKPRAVVGILA
ncbi:hypothetical protein BJX96DRAFT_103440 [Aspergillus floccosus]